MMEYIHNISKFLCIAATISLTIYCTYEFLLNNDLTEVAFVNFNQNEESVYPQLALCFLEEYSLLEDKIQKLGDGINPTTYIQFLKGKIWDER